MQIAQLQASQDPRKTEILTRLFLFVVSQLNTCIELILIVGPSCRGILRVFWGGDPKFGKKFPPLPLGVPEGKILRQYP